MVERKPIPIPVGLALKLREAVGDRPGGDPLLLCSDGTRWRRLDLLFRQAAGLAGLDPNVTGYSLRHSAVVRGLMSGVPIRVIASLMDTSTQMIEKNYSRYIVGDASDALIRRAMLDLGEPAPADNVVALRQK
jgi:integrase